MQVLRGIQNIDPKNLVRGQYRGYRDEKGVAPSLFDEFPSYPAPTTFCKGGG